MIPSSLMGLVPPGAKAALVPRPCNKQWDMMIVGWFTGPEVAVEAVHVFWDYAADHNHCNRVGLSGD